MYCFTSKENNLPICSVYGDVVTDDEETGQTNLSDFMDMEEFELGRPIFTYYRMR